MLLRLTSSSFGSLFFIRSSVSSTSVEFGSSSGTGLYCVGLITPRVTHKREVAHRNMGITFPRYRDSLKEVVAAFGDISRGATPCMDSAFDVLQELGEFLKLSERRCPPR